MSYLQPLPWDSAKFGFPIALLPAELDETALRNELIHAGRNGIHLVYWLTDHQRLVSPHVLTDFAGRLVDHKAIFAATLGDCADWPLPEGVKVAEYPRGPASKRLIELSLAAGASSRFRVDPRFPEDKFRLLYETWIQRCTLREIGGTVLTVYDTRDDEPAGMITLSIKDGVGSIDLLAVLEEFRGQGLAHALGSAGHAWMQQNGATRSRVVTQLENAVACRFYRRLGYEVETVNDFYHFWVGGA